MKIGLFYSYGPHFLKAIHFLCEKYPKDQIILFIPQEFPSYYFEKLPVSPVFLPWDGQHLSTLKGIGTFINILRIIRSQKLDQFVILFESPRQITLSTLSGARHTFVYSIHKEYKNLSQGIFKSLSKTFVNRLKGILMYSYIFFHIHFSKTRNKSNFHH